MSQHKLRQKIAFEAARLMYFREESEYHRAKLKAGRRISRGSLKPRDLPSNREIRDQIQTLAQMYEGARQTRDLREMRYAALRMMHLLRAFCPRLVGSVLTGQPANGSDIDLHLFSDDSAVVCQRLEEAGLVHDARRTHVRRGGQQRLHRHIHVYDEFRFELTLHDEDAAQEVFQSSVTGLPVERASIADLEKLLQAEYGEEEPRKEPAPAAHAPDRFLVFRSLLLPLDEVKQDPRSHPEGDALYHSLQVFELAREAAPYDEEFLLAALLHDVGKAIDRRDPTAAALEALGEFITERTAWLIAHHREAHALAEGTLGVRPRKRLTASEYYDDVKLLRDLDVEGRAIGAAVVDVDDALAYIRELADDNEGW